MTIAGMGNFHNGVGGGGGAFTSLGGGGLLRMVTKVKSKKRINNEQADMITLVMMETVAMCVARYQ